MDLVIILGANVNQRDEFGYTALMAGSSAGYPLVVKAILQARCDPNLQSVTGLTALHVASKAGETCIIQLLLLAGATTHQTNNHGETPLSFAIQHGCTEDVEALLLGCTYTDPNWLHLSQRSQLPLYNVMKRGHFCICQTLVLAGYKCIEELHQYFAELTSSRSKDDDLGVSNDLELSTSERDSYYFLSHDALQPASLQNLTRLRIRKLLNFNIWTKSSQLGLPQKLESYICFGDLYKPPQLQTDY